MQLIPKREIPIVWKLFIYSLGIATSYVVARTVGDSLFLSTIGNEYLSYVYVMAGCCTAIFAGIWYLATKKFSVGTTIQCSSVLFASLTLAAWWVLPVASSSFLLLAAIYLLAEVKGCINAINIVSALNTKLGKDASKSAWATVGLAAPLAAVLMGGVLALESTVFELRDWLLIIVALDLFTGFTGFLLGRSAKVEDFVHAHEVPKLESEQTAKRNTTSKKFQRWIGILIGAKVVALTIVSFEWKSAVNAFFSGESENLVRFFGIYYASVGFVTIALQIFLTSRLLYGRYYGVALLFMPIGLLFLTGLFVFSPAILILLSAATAAKAMDAWRRSVHDTTLNMLYTHIRRAKRRFAISLNSGLIKPISEVAAAILILFGTAQLYRPTLLLVLVIWLIAAGRLVLLVIESRENAKSDLSRFSKTNSIATEAANLKTGQLWRLSEPQ